MLGEEKNYKIFVLGCNFDDWLLYALFSFGALTPEKLRIGAKSRSSVFVSKYPKIESAQVGRIPGVRLIIKFFSLNLLD